MFALTSAFVAIQKASYSLHVGTTLLQQSRDRVKIKMEGVLACGTFGVVVATFVGLLQLKRLLNSDPRLVRILQGAKSSPGAIRRPLSTISARSSMPQACAGGG